MVTMTTTPRCTLADAGLNKQKPMFVPGPGKRRRIDAKTGQALVILEHAIEYLASEFVFAAGTLNPERGQLDAIQLLMAKNRDIYFACPEVPTFWQVLRSLLHPNKESSASSELTQSRV